MPVIKSISRKGRPDFKRIVKYILKEQKQEAWVLLHNIDENTEDKEAIIQSFQNNYAQQKQRKNGTAYFHEILSFHQLDKKALMQNPWIMEELTREYLQRRAQHAIALAYPHLDDDHLHTHILIGNRCTITGKSVRISKAEFRKIKRDIEELLIEQYPEILHSNIKKHLGRLKERGR